MLGVIRWYISQYYANLSFETLKTAVQQNPNQNYLDNFSSVAKAVNRSNEIRTGEQPKDFSDRYKMQTKWNGVKLEGGSRIFLDARKSIASKNNSKNKKILLIASFHPPHHLNEDDNFCELLYNFLRSKGFPIRVLVSDYISPRYTECGLYPHPYVGVYRDLKLETMENNPNIVNGMSMIDRTRIQQHNTVTVKNMIDKFEPDLIVTWNLSRFSVSFVHDLEGYGLPLLNKKMILEEIGTYDETLTVKLSDWIENTSFAKKVKLE